jgi:hypothetical protein
MAATDIAAYRAVSQKPFGVTSGYAFILELTAHNDSTVPFHGCRSTLPPRLLRAYGVRCHSERNTQCGSDLGFRSRQATF